MDKFGRARQNFHLNKNYSLAHLGEWPCFYSQKSVPPPLPLLLRHPPAELLEEEGGGRLVVLQGQGHRVASLLNRDVEV